MSWNKPPLALEPARSQPTSVHTTPVTRARTDVLLCVAVLAAVGAVVYVSQVVPVSETLRDVALFVHLVCVVAGLGSVLVVDWFGLRWQLGHTSLENVVATAGALAIPIWFGLCGLLLSGIFLEPDLSQPATRAKMVFVAIAGLVGVLANGVQRRMSAQPAFRRSRGLVRAGIVLALASQISWWGATVIGFLNRA
ncbi:hypothetical protein [Phytoactinopolyspora halotolerans]|uniref:Uncharacterized protein n=1 Tax=Phytoactinopolyspora halotolerans TaxID=1981512 RepID=A0A6L9S4H2_9ACTN|nr:hypothetical protein [Phytoactinopolyspora halotolerans]NED99988.1 hypothetical protein [Phytoactinopolyspora halotolerans]